MKKSSEKFVIYDVIVIGGGPAGMIAAGQAASRGAKVLLVEKNPDVGKKLLITGGGRCNVTNAEEDTRKLLANYKDSGKFLFSAFAQHSVSDSLKFFHEHGMDTKVEDNGRVFPTTDSAKTVQELLKKFLMAGKVKITNQTEVKEILHKNTKVVGLKLADNTIQEARSYILATGGKSRPETGSTGDGFVWLKDLGHTITEPDVSLVPITIKENWISQLAGITLDSVKITVSQDSKKQLSRMGKILFTHVGVSGPTILNMSKNIRELLDYGQVKLMIDLFPTLTEGELDKNLTKIFQTSNKQFKNSLTPLLPSNLANTIASLSSIPLETESNSITRDNRKRLVKLLKTLPLSVKGLLSTDKAIITSGGVALTEINFKTMQSRLFDNLYIVGDLLNIDRPSGGYSLQLCWTTGFVAGDSVEVNSGN
ncbi:MAG: NAD(P)/FAD-dependent oxidoreductase [Candidatus Pacebacteria bacterium]|nr:NAD(P)/FAD-dependent oxidoreductase [Candidatus Paceibacterota bacterium]